MGEIKPQLSELALIFLFLQFWFSPWGGAKGEKWEAFSHDRPFLPSVARQVVQDVLAGKRDEWNWDVLDLPNVYP